MAEALQQLVLDTLERSGVIEDTRTLHIPGEAGPALSNDAQITILGALNSLTSRDVRSLLILVGSRVSKQAGRSVDDRLQNARDLFQRADA
jgi:hypothetical protein